MANKDFFLSPDDSQTLGNISYMRKSVRVRHTFPKTLKNPGGFSVEKEVSSSNGRTVDGFANSSNQISSFSSPTVTPVQKTDNNNDAVKPVEVAPKKRPQGTSMDMFRNMARNLGKK